MNKVILAGRLVKDPEVKYTQTGIAWGRFTLAINRRFSKDNTADFISVIVWDKLAEIVGNNLVKGSQVLIEGRIQNRSYDAQDGRKRYVTEVIGNDIEFLGGKPKADGGEIPELAKDFGQEVPQTEEVPF